jgi:hypothetical protein
MKEISSLDYLQHGEVIYFYGQALLRKSCRIKSYKLNLREENGNFVLNDQLHTSNRSFTHIRHN